MQLLQCVFRHLLLSSNIHSLPSTWYIWIWKKDIGNHSGLLHYHKEGTSTASDNNQACHSKAIVVIITPQMWVSLNRVSVSRVCAISVADLTHSHLPMYLWMNGQPPSIAVNSLLVYNFNLDETTWVVTNTKSKAFLVLSIRTTAHLHSSCSDNRFEENSKNTSSSWMHFFIFFNVT